MDRLLFDRTLRYGHSVKTEAEINALRPAKFNWNQLPAEISSSQRAELLASRNRWRDIAFTAYVLSFLTISGLFLTYAYVHFVSIACLISLIVCMVSIVMIRRKKRALRQFDTAWRSWLEAGETLEPVCREAVPIISGVSHTTKLSIKLPGNGYSTQHIFCGYTAANDIMLQRLEEAYRLPDVVIGQNRNLWLDIAMHPNAIEEVAIFCDCFCTITKDTSHAEVAALLDELPHETQQSFKAACDTAMQRIERATGIIVLPSWHQDVAAPAQSYDRSIVADSLASTQDFASHMNAAIVQYNAYARMSVNLS